MALRTASALLLLPMLARCCTYDENLGTSVQCNAPAPVAATAGNEDEAVGGVKNLGGAGLPAVYAVLSDWGGSGVAPFTTPGQVAASKALNAVCASQSCKAVLSAGGNFLPGGLPGSADGAASKARFAATFTSIYGLGPALAVPWYLTGGAPDWLGNITAERALTVPEATSGTMTWHFPELWQSLSFVVPPGYGTLQVIMVDTVLLLGELEPPTARAAPSASVAVSTAAAPALVAPRVAATAVSAVPLATAAALPAAPVKAAPAVKPAVAEPALAAPLAEDAPAVTPRVAGAAARRLADFNAPDDPPPESTPQWTWLEAELSASTADWLIVVGNDPLWSAGAAGPAPGLAARLLPLMQSAGAALYIGGRDPLAQHFVPITTAPAVDVIVVGNGAVGNASQAAALPNKAACPAGALQFSYGGGAGFATLAFAVPSANATAAALTVTFYDESGTNLYSFTKPATRKGKAAPPPVAGQHGRRSGLLMLMLMFMVVGMGVAYWMLLASLPMAPDVPLPRPKTAPRKREADPLLGAATGNRFNTFSL